MDDSFLAMEARYAAMDGALQLDKIWRRGGGEGIFWLLRQLKHRRFLSKKPSAVARDVPRE